MLEHIKNKFSIIKITIIILITVQTTFSQEKKDLNKIAIIEQRIEMIAEDNEEENIDFTTLFDDLMHYYENPLELNHAKKEDLQALTLLNEIQINNLLSHIRKNGELIAVYELQSIDGFDLETIQKILPFVQVNRDFYMPEISLKQILKTSNSEFLYRQIRVMEEKKGYMPITDSALAANPESRYLGSPDLIFTRFRIKYKNNISIGITAEKDAGEEFFKGAQKNGFDFYSAHFYLKNWGKLKHFVAGDYVLQFGQGLTLWASRAFNKNAFDVLGIKKNAMLIRPLTSAGVTSLKDAFFRGTAATYSIKKFDLTGFYSMNYVDGSIIQIDNIGDGSTDAFSGAGNGGFHRTPKEVAKKNNVGVELYGGHLSYKGKRFEIGATGAQREYTTEYYPKIRLDSQFNFEGKKNSVFGADYNYVVRNLNFFGEISRSENGGMGQIHGALIALDPRISAVVSYRNYQRDYQPLFANPLRESYFSNEKGFYLGIASTPINNVTISGYVDKFKFPWLTYFNSSPSQGVDYVGQVLYKPTKKMEFYIRYRGKIKEYSFLPANGYMKKLHADTGQTVRFNAVYKMTDAIKLQTRVQLIRWDIEENKQESGYLIFQDIVYHPLKQKYSFSFRYALFDTESYLTRIYAYENDMLGVFSVPAYYYRGSRTYLMVQYKILRNLDVWLRWSQTFYSNRDVIGSGLEEIQGNTKTEFKAQIRYKF